MQQQYLDLVFAHRPHSSRKIRFSDRSGNQEPFCNRVFLGAGRCKRSGLRLCHAALSALQFCNVQSTMFSDSFQQVDLLTHSSGCKFTIALQESRFFERASGQCLTSRPGYRMLAGLRTCRLKKKSGRKTRQALRPRYRVPVQKPEWDVSRSSIFDIGNVMRHHRPVDNDLDFDFRLLQATVHDLSTMKLSASTSGEARDDTWLLLRLALGLNWRLSAGRKA